jgi:hypothetical protein
MAAVLAVRIGSGETPPDVNLSKPIRLHEGRGPSLVTHENSFAILYSRSLGEGKGWNLYFRPSLETKTEFQVNRIFGEVRDGGENGPILLKDQSKGALYAIWNAADPRHTLGNVLKFAAWNSERRTWSEPITINDDTGTSTHTFQGAAVGPDGVVHVAWLDRREVPVGKPEDYPGGGVKTEHKLLDDTVVIYTAKWSGGKTFSRNVRVAGNVCACCRASIAFVGKRMLIAWRSVDTGGIRDIALAASADNGRTWSAPRVAVRDDWKINACPHVGPAMATIGDSLFLSWMTRGARRSGVFFTVSRDRGQTFGEPQLLSNGIGNATHPALTAGADFGIAVLQGTIGKTIPPVQDHSSHGSHGEPSGSQAFLYVLGRAGTGAQPIQIPGTGAGLTYPVAAIGKNGRFAVAWTQIHEGQATGWVATGTVVR